MDLDDVLNHSQVFLWFTAEDASFENVWHLGLVVAHLFCFLASGLWILTLTEWVVHEVVPVLVYQALLHIWQVVWRLVLHARFRVDQLLLVINLMSIYHQNSLLAYLVSVRLKHVKFFVLKGALSSKEEVIVRDQSFVCILLLKHLLCLSIVLFHFFFQVYQLLDRDHLRLSHNCVLVEIVHLLHILLSIIWSEKLRISFFFNYTLPFETVYLFYHATRLFDGHPLAHFYDIFIQHVLQGELCADKTLGSNLLEIVIFLLGLADVATILDGSKLAVNVFKGWLVLVLLQGYENVRFLNILDKFVDLKFLENRYFAALAVGWVLARFGFPVFESDLSRVKKLDELYRFLVNFFKNVWLVALVKLVVQLTQNKLCAVFNIFEALIIEIFLDLCRQKFQEALELFVLVHR